MASWKIVVRSLYLVGGTSTASNLQMMMESDSPAVAGLSQARDYGLARCNGSRGGPNTRNPATWTLTRKGIDWAEGRVRDTHGSKITGIPGAGLMRFLPTWLAALPRDVRITPGPLQLAAHQPQDLGDRYA